MIIWLNGCFGVGKTATAAMLHKLIVNSHIYDPEQVGAFLWENFPEPLKRKGDFQDIELWRKINYEYIEYMYRNFDGHIIIPMTIVNSNYYQEIIGKLQEKGIEIRHYILLASKDVVIERLIHRGEEKESWAEKQIDRCFAAFDNDISGYKIDTNRMSVKQVAESIFRECFLDNQSK